MYPNVIAKKPTPIFNTLDLQGVFGGNQRSLPFDDQRLVRELEMIAFPGTVFEVINDGLVLEVKTDIYPSSKSLYIDSRFVELHDGEFAVQSELPSREEILSFMKCQVGAPYIWGGNFVKGIPELKKYFPPRHALTDHEDDYWMFMGCDCSGLLYEATNGFLPRNTDELKGVGMAGSLDDLQPLDLVLYTEKDGSGHVFVILNESEVIESKLAFGGVTITPLLNRFAMLTDSKSVELEMESYISLDLEIRRWFDT